VRKFYTGLATLKLLIVLFFILQGFISLQDGINISVTNLRNNKGYVLISLFKDGVGYPDNTDKAFRKGQVSIKDGKASIAFYGLPKGTYAVAILHDENNDQKMNKSGLGLPKEGYGFSNNVMGAFGPPSFNRASFKYAGSGLSQVNIRTKY
jgi:uncharacterized protein (DUF2141 family)